MKETQHQKLRILIADDDEDDRYFIRLAFKESNMDHDLDFVEDGEELLNYLRGLGNEERHPDFILLDLNMPKKDGRTALKEIRADAKLQKLKIVIFSTCISEDDKKYAAGLDVSMLIVKPSDFYELIKILKEICEVCTLTEK